MRSKSSKFVTSITSDSEFGNSCKCMTLPTCTNGELTLPSRIEHEHSVQFPLKKRGANRFRLVRGSLGTSLIWWTCLTLVCCTLLPLSRADGNDSSKSAEKKEISKPGLIQDEDKVKEGGIKHSTRSHLIQKAADSPLKADDKLIKVDLGFIHAFVASLSVIVVSELGDKTFFIAAIMAMRYSRLTVFMGAIAALFFMTVLSAMLGYATTVIPRWLTYYVSSALFAIFGIKMLREGFYMAPDEGHEEYEVVQADLRRKEEEYERQGASQAQQDVEAGIVRTPHRRFLYNFVSRIFIQSFVLTFLAEWGDRSQIATIILGAREEVIGVILGGTLGHSMCTGLAVLGGRFIAQRISIRTVTLVGGVVFLIFALSAFFIEPDN